MKSMFVFIGLVVAAAAQTDLVPYDGVGGGEVQWCRVNDDCTIFGDVAATCLNGVCQCTEPKYRYLSSAWGCFPREFQSIDQVLTVFSITITITFSEVDCEKFFALNPTGSDDLIRVVQFLMRLALKYNVVTCGSVNVAVQADGTASDLVRLSTLADDLPTELEKVASLADLAKSPISVSLSTAQSGACAMDNANATAVIEGRCNALTCNPGYNVTTSSAGVQLCLPSSVSKSSDDDLTDAEIAGIVLGSCALAGCIIAIIVVFVMSGKKEEEPIQKNYPVQQQTNLAPPKEPSNLKSDDLNNPNAPFGGDDHAQPNEPTSDDGTEGTIVV